MFICRQKINLSFTSFLRYYIQFKESWNFIGWQHFGSLLETQNFARYGGEISITMLFFILDYFQEKLTWQNFPKNSENPILRPLWALFAQIFAQMNFPGKKRLCQFLNISIVIASLCQKSEEINEPFLRKMLNCWTSRQTDRQQRFYGTLLGTWFQLLK